MTCDTNIDKHTYIDIHMMAKKHQACCLPYCRSSQMIVWSSQMILVWPNQMILVLPSQIIVLPNQMMLVLPSQMIVKSNQGHVLPEYVSCSRHWQ